MGFVPQSGSTEEIKVYLTELGRRRLLEQGFKPVTDITGDYNDNVYAISKNITIKGQILRK